MRNNVYNTAMKFIMKTVGKVAWGDDAPPLPNLKFGGGGGGLVAPPAPSPPPASYAYGVS